MLNIVRPRRYLNLGMVSALRIGREAHAHGGCAKFMQEFATWRGQLRPCRLSLSCRLPACFFALP
eukprot:COSAG01_NODE_3924_length_5529_cov_1.581584_6_plen_65_part_00